MNGHALRFTERRRRRSGCSPGRLLNNGLGAAVTLGRTGLRLGQVLRYTKLFISEISIQIYSGARVAVPTVISRQPAYHFPVPPSFDIRLYSVTPTFTQCKPAF